MRQLRLGIYIAVVVASWSQVAAAQSEAKQLLAKAAPGVQSQIRATAIAYLSGGRSESEIRTNWKGFRELEKLKGLAADDAELVEQLAIYAFAEQRPEEQQALEALLILQLINVKPGIPIRVLAPYLDSDDKVLRGFVRDWFESHAGRATQAEFSANYKDYSDYLSLRLSKGDPVPGAFVEFMFKQSPGQALLAFIRVDRRGMAIEQLSEIHENLSAARQGEAVAPGPRPPTQKPHRDIRLSVRLIDNAIWFKENGEDEHLQAALPEINKIAAKLAQDERWWVRRYVVEIMRRHAEFRSEDALKRLLEDRDVSVRKVAESIRE